MNKKTSIQLLNKGVADELQAVHQYMYWHFHLDDQGFGPLSLLLNQAAIQCSQNADAVSKQLFESLVGDEERHFDQFDKQLENIKRFGTNYLALQSFERAPEQPEAAEE